MGVSKPGAVRDARQVDRDLVDEDGVVAAMNVGAQELQGVRAACRDREGRGDQRAVAGAGEVVEGAHHAAVHQHLERLAAGHVAALGGQEADRVVAGAWEVDGLADAAGTCRKATWLPWGALGLPLVKPLPLPDTPAVPVKVQGEPMGWYLKFPATKRGVSKPGSRRMPHAGLMDGQRGRRRGSPELRARAAPQWTGSRYKTVTGAVLIRRPHVIEDGDGEGLAGVGRRSEGDGCRWCRCSLGGTGMLDAAVGRALNCTVAWLSAPPLAERVRR